MALYADSLALNLLRKISILVMMIISPLLPWPETPIQEKVLSSMA